MSEAIDQLEKEAGVRNRLRASAWLAAQVHAQAARWTLWTPVAFGLGAALYFQLPREPTVWLAVAAGVAAGVLLLASRQVHRRWMTICLALAAFGLAGFAVTKARTERAAAPIAENLAAPVSITAWVVDVASPGQGGQRLLLAPVAIEGLAPRQTPIRVRVTLREGTEIPPPGSAIRLLAKIGPPPSPAAPGSYDFARDAYFQSVGAVGFALGAPQAWRPSGAGPWRLRMEMRLNALRWNMARRIVDRLGPETGGLAAAMTSGVEAFVPPQQVEDLRAAGLAHIISISGLHMAIVGGFAFAAVRLGVAAWPWLALRISGKKAAALAGLAAVGGYLLLSGASPPAERAAVTAAVAFLAVLVDRQAISLHALALAAMVVLVLQPEAVMAPGFQMSFAATAALVALAEVWPRPVREINTPWPIRMAQGVGVWIAAGVSISLVAGLATGPFAIQHFNRVASFGLIANLLVEPISTLIMMPGLALAAVLAPIGLDGPPLALAGFGIGLMTHIASAVAQAPFAQVTVASAPGWALAVAFLGLLFVCLIKGPLRFVGLPFALMVSLAPHPSIPAAWVASDGAALAVRDGGQAILLRPDVKLFGAELWARRYGLAPGDEAARDARFVCEPWSCGPQPSAPVPLAAAWNLRRPLKAGRLDDLCASAQIVVLRNDFRPEACRAPLVLTGADFARGGAAEIHADGAGGWRVVWAQDLRGRRPWTWGPDRR